MKKTLETSAQRQNMNPFFQTTGKKDVQTSCSPN